MCVLLTVYVLLTVCDADSVCARVAGNFQAGEAGSVLKKLDSREHQSLQRLMHDRLQPFVPEFRGVVEKNGERILSGQPHSLARLFYFIFYLSL